MQRHTEMVYVEEPFDFVQDGFKESVGFEGGAQRAADFVEHVKLLRAARGLLDEITVFHCHADLMAQRKKEAKFRGGKPPGIRGAEEQNAEGLLLGLQADAHDGTHALAHGQLTETAESF